MRLKLESLSDVEFLEEFENLTLKPEEFNHTAHIRIAWLYLSKYNLEDAILLTCKGIKCYAESLGAKEKYHATITCALVRIISLKKNLSRGQNFACFIDTNKNLVNNALKILKQYYSDELLFSEKARLTYVEPDISRL